MHEPFLRPAETPNLYALVQTFTLCTSDSFVKNFGPTLLARVSKEAPRVQLRFLQKVDKDRATLREEVAGLHRPSTS